MSEVIFLGSTVAKWETLDEFSLLLLDDPMIKDKLSLPSIL